jgi:hypothetical protein
MKDSYVYVEQDSSTLRLKLASDKKLPLNLFNVVERLVLCRLPEGELIYVLKVDGSLPSRANLVKYTLASKGIHPDLAYALLVFRIKIMMASVATAFDNKHISERDYTFKLLGLLEALFVEEKL